MNYTNYKITLDMKRIQSQVSIPVPQNDTARRLYIRLFQNGKIFELKDGIRAVFAGEKPDGTVLYNDCLIENQNTIRYDFTEQTTAVIGTVNCQIRVYLEDGSLLTTPSLTIVVYENVFSEDNIESSDEYHALNQLMEEANTLIFEVNQKLENGDFVGKSGVYVGSGEMPEDANVQIDPLGGPSFEAGAPRVLYLNEDGEFSLLEAGSGFDIEEGIISAVGDKETKKRVAVLETKVKELAEKESDLPTVTVSDNGKILQAKNGAWEAAPIGETAVKTYIDDYISSALGGEY